MLLVSCANGPAPMVCERADLAKPGAAIQVNWFLKDYHPNANNMPHNLTPRQSEVVRLISLGCSTVEISRIIGVTPSTVDTHRSAAVETAGVSNLALLTRWAIYNRVSSMKDALTPAEQRRRGRKKDGWN
jgi:DNA-binding CsgD family transcriptional regulator